jgi:F0F1-type ATP synthase epsilon subunit
VVFGGLVEFSQEALTILADASTSIEEFDLAELETKIQEMEEAVTKSPPGDELDRAIALLDHYKSIHINLAPATPF